MVALNFDSCVECINGIQEVLELKGTLVESKYISGKHDDRDMLEIIGASIELTGWADRYEAIRPLGDANARFLEQEFRDWINYEPNPGKAWHEDPELWGDYLKGNGKFYYTYPERFSIGNQLGAAMALLKTQPNTRQAFVNIWDCCDVSAAANNNERVPCTIGYHFLLRKNRLNMVYFMRSLCADWNLANDLWLSTHLLEYMAEGLRRPAGIISLHIGSLHRFVDKDDR